MKNPHIIFCSLFIILASLSCEKSGEISDIQKCLTKDNKITILGTEREYDLFIPEDTNSCPIVVLLHGHGSSSDDLTGESGKKAPYKKWMDIAFENKLILIIPNGITGPDGNSGWNDCRADGTGNPDIDDLEFIKQTIDDIISKYSVNENKIYVTGTSNGGFMSMRLALEIPQKITAAAAIVASMSNNSECTPSNDPVSVLFMNGTDDPLVPYNGGEVASNRGDAMSADDAVNYWVNKNGTDSIAEYVKFDDINSSDNSTIEKFSYKNGLNNTEVVLYKVSGGGHTEPSILERYSSIVKPLLGEQNGDIEMADEVWSFFKDKSK